MEITVYMITGEVFTITTNQNMTIVKFCELLQNHIYIYDKETCIKSDNVIAFTL